MAQYTVWLDGVKTVIRILLWPLLVLLSLVLYIVHWVIWPVLYFGHLISYTLSLPVRFLAQFEALWYFLGCAVFIGSVAGLTIYGIVHVFVLVFDLDRKPPPKAIPAKGHDAASYRAARAEKKRKEQEKQDRRALRTKLLASEGLIQDVVREARHRPVTLSSPVSPNTSNSATRSGLFNDIILEQTDEEDSAF